MDCILAFRFFKIYLKYESQTTELTVVFRKRNTIRKILQNVSEILSEMYLKFRRNVEDRSVICTRLEFGSLSMAPRVPRVLRKPRRRHFSRESRALVSSSGGAAQGTGGLNAWSAGGTGFYGKTTLTRTLDLPLPVEDIARRRHRQSVRFEATFTGLHEGSASLSVLAGITFHVLCVPNHRYSGPYLYGREERSWPSGRS